MSSLNICRQMALFEMVHALILRFANMEKWINSLNLSTPIFRTLQYVPSRQGVIFVGKNILIHSKFLDRAQLWTDEP